MLLFLDTADLDQIRKFAFMIDGITTTPTIIKRDGAKLEKFTRTVRDEFPELELHIEALADSVEATEALIESYTNQDWYSKDKVCFKVPISHDGLKTVINLRSKGSAARINLHMVFSSAQAALAFQVGADYVSPLIGRYADESVGGSNGQENIGVSEIGSRLINDIMACKSSIKSSAIVLASSIRSVEYFVISLNSGVDAITLPPDVLEQAMSHPMTDEGVELLWKDLE